LTTIFGGLLIGLPVIPLAVSAQTRPVPSRCPGVYYEEPWNSTVITPEDCPPNAVTERFLEEGRLPARQADTQTSPERTQQPLPEERSEPVATVIPTEGTLNVRVKNNTNAVVRYQAIGYTDYRPLAGGEETILRNIPLPATIAFARQDDGFVRVTPISSSDQEGMLEVSLDEDATPGDSNQGVLRIQADGQVFLN
jgi:hypothetical protein